MTFGTVFGAAMSTCTQRIFVVANEVGADLDLSVIDFASGGHKKEPHISRQPFGQVPAFEGNGVKLFESRAIARYIDAKNGGKLTQINNLDKYALVETWISVETSNFDKYAAPIVYEIVFKPMFGMTTDKDEVEKLKAKFIPMLDVTNTFI